MLSELEVLKNGRTVKFYKLFQFTDLAQNSNKFWAVAVFSDGEVITVNGRVGAAPQIHHLGNGGQILADTKVAEKIRKGYKEVLLATPVIEIDDSSASKIDGRVAAFMLRLVGSAQTAISHYLNTTVDALSQSAIDTARGLLAQALDASRAGNTWLLNSSVSKFYNIIPTKLPARIDRAQVVADFIRNAADIENRLNQLEAALKGLKVKVSGISDPEKILGAKLTPVETSDPVFKKIAARVAAECNHGYAAVVKEVFAVEIPNERKAFDGCSVGNICQYWHGTQEQNVQHILRQGLIVPNYQANGRAYGNGVYFSSQFSKSANYCDGHAKGNGSGVIIMADVKMGKTYKVTSSYYGHSGKPAGYDSLTDAGQNNGGYFMNPEMVVYNTNQITIRYLVVFEKKGSRY